jgi:putative endonuclease
MRVAEAYLHERRLIPSPTRFDVVAVLFGAGDPDIEHFENAFGYFV